MAMWQVGRVMPIEECVDKRGLVHGTCPGLVEGSEYTFRIKAVNLGKYFTGLSFNEDNTTANFATLTFSNRHNHLIYACTSAQLINDETCTSAQLINDERMQ